MNIANTFQTQGEKPFILDGEKPANPEMQEHPAQSQWQSQWQRVLDVILVEGELRYLVERGE